MERPRKVLLTPTAFPVVLHDHTCGLAATNQTEHRRRGVAWHSTAGAFLGNQFDDLEKWCAYHRYGSQRSGFGERVVPIIWSDWQTQRNDEIALWISQNNYTGPVLIWNEPSNIHQANMPAKRAASSYCVAASTLPSNDLVTPNNIVGNGTGGVGGFSYNRAYFAEIQRLCPQDKPKYLGLHFYFLEVSVDSAIATACDAWRDAFGSSHPCRVWITELGMFQTQSHVYNRYLHILIDIIDHPQVERYYGWTPRGPLPGEPSMVWEQYGGGSLTPAGKAWLDSWCYAAHDCTFLPPPEVVDLPAYP